MADLKPFVHLHCHSHYSLLDGASPIKKLVAKAKELGMNALALTDHGNLYGALEFYQACRAVLRGVSLEDDGPVSLSHQKWQELLDLQALMAQYLRQMGEGE